jgi:hypothetical protein
VLCDTYAEPDGVFGARSALSFPTIFPTCSRFCLLAVERTTSSEQRSLCAAIPCFDRQPTLHEVARQ